MLMPRRKPGRRTYSTDLTDTQWALIVSLIPASAPGGRPRKATSRELVNAILYFLRAGMAWRLLPHDLPPWQTVYYYLRRWQREGVWDRVHHIPVRHSPAQWHARSHHRGRPALPRARGEHHRRAQ